MGKVSFFCQTLATLLFLKLRFTPCKAKQPLRGMELKEKEAQKDKTPDKVPTSTYTKFRDI